MPAKMSLDTQVSLNLCMAKLVHTVYSDTIFIIAIDLGIANKNLIPLLLYWQK